MIIKKYNEYIDQLHEVYPKIEKDQLKRVIKTFLHLFIQTISRNEDITLSTKNFFLGVVSVRDKEEANKFAFANYKTLQAYKKYRTLSKKYENEQKNSNNKHV